MAEAARKPQEAPQEGPQLEAAPELSEDAKAEADAAQKATQADIEALKAEGQAAESQAQSRSEKLREMAEGVTDRAENKAAEKKFNANIDAQIDMDNTVEEMKAGNIDTDSSPDEVIKTDLVADAEATLTAAGISTADLAAGKVGFFKKLMNRKAIKAWEAASANQYDNLDKTAEVSASMKGRASKKGGGGNNPPMGLS